MWRKLRKKKRTIDIIIKRSNVLPPPSIEDWQLATNDRRILSKIIDTSRTVAATTESLATKAAPESLCVSYIRHLECLKGYANHLLDAVRTYIDVGGGMLEHLLLLYR